MKILITGAAGFIGFHTARALIDRGDEVTGLDNLNAYYDVGLKEVRLAQLRSLVCGTSPCTVPGADRTWLSSNLCAKFWLMSP